MRRKLTSGAKEGDEKVEKQIAGAKARPDSASVIAGTKVPAYLILMFFRSL
jgi:hypothetical protein